MVADFDREVFRPPLLSRFWRFGKSDVVTSSIKGKHSSKPCYDAHVRTQKKERNKKEGGGFFFFAIGVLEIA